jgi:capsid assembly protease
MRLVDVVSAPWAITPEMHTEVLGIYARHCRGEKIDVEALEARLGVPLKNTTQPASVDPESGVAVIDISGVLAKRMNLFSQISGGASTQLIGQQLAQALADPSVTGIVLYIDSPGGAVDGTQQLAEQVYAARGQKPIVAYTDGMMASAAYWIGSAADTVLIAGDTTQVGSIGVIATHVDRSMAQAQNGVKVTEVKAGKYKGHGSSNGPLGAGEVTLQDQVDKLYEVFVDTVARNRGMTAEEIQAAAEGRVFIGKDAIEAGLVDGVSTLAGAIALAAGTPPATSQAPSAGVAPTASTTTETAPMLTVEKVKADAPAVYLAIIEEGKAMAAASHAEGLKAARAEGATQERARLAGIEANALPGTEALVKEAKADANCTPEAFAVKVVSFVRERNSKALADLDKDAKGVQVPHAAAPEAAQQEAAEQKPGAVAVQAANLASKAREYVDSQAKLGRTVSVAEAVQHVSASK